MAVLASLGVLAWPAVARPNAGPTSTSAWVVAEPPGIPGVRIAHETLSIDLRPADRGEAAVVEATYQLDSKGGETQLELLFAFGSQRNTDWSITLDDKPLEGVLVVGADLPATWMPPPKTPGLEGGKSLFYGPGWRTVEPLAFKLVVPSGRSVLKVRYQAEVSLNYARPSMYRQFAYILSPARSWAGFGGLDLQIQFPSGWSVASTLELAREGASLSGSFDRIPAESIAITMRPHIPAGYQRVFEVSRAVAILLGFVGWVVCWKSGYVWVGGAVRSAAVDDRSRYSQAVKLLGVATVIGILYGILMAVAGWWTVFGPDVVFAPPASEQALARRTGLSDGYLALIKIAGVFLLAGVLAGTGGLLALVAGLLPRRSELRKDLPT